MIANTRNKQKLFYSGVIVNALSNSPGEYYCKIETQRNWRESTQVVEHVV